MRRTVVAVLIGVVLAVATPVSRASAAEKYIEELGLGMAAIGSNLFYVPAKFIYAVGGGMVGSLGYALTGGNLKAAHNIWSPSLGGTWVLTPEMMGGTKPILFSGESYEPPAQ